MPGVTRPSFPDRPNAPDGRGVESLPSPAAPPVRRGRQEILTERIVGVLQQQPGILQRDLFRVLGEKDILVLSLLDQLVVGSLIERRGEPTRLYINGRVPPEMAVEGIGEVVADQRVENALILIDLYRLCQWTLSLRVEVGGGLRAYRGDQRVLTALFGREGCELKLYATNREQLGTLRPGLENGGCDIEESEAEGCIRIVACSRASLLRLLGSVAAAFGR